MILKMYIADQLCYEYIFEPHFRWYESMISLTLLTPCIFSFVNLYMYIVYYGLCFTISWQKSHFLFVWTVHQKTIYLALIKQSLLRFQPEGLCIVCWTTQTIVGTLTFTVLVIFTSVQLYFLYKAPAHIHPHKGHPLIL